MIQPLKQIIQDSNKYIILKYLSIRQSMGKTTQKKQENLKQDDNNYQQSDANNSNQENQENLYENNQNQHIENNEKKYQKYKNKKIAKSYNDNQQYKKKIEKKKQNINTQKLPKNLKEENNKHGESSQQEQQSYQEVENQDDGSSELRFSQMAIDEEEDEQDNVSPISDESGSNKQNNIKKQFVSRSNSKLSPQQPSDKIISNQILTEIVTIRQILQKISKKMFPQVSHQNQDLPCIPMIKKQKIQTFQRVENCQIKKQNYQSVKTSTVITQLQIKSEEGRINEKKQEKQKKKKNSKESENNRIIIE